MCFFLAGFNLISFLISFSVFQGSVLDLLFNSYRACFFRVKWSKDEISIINHMYQLCYLTIVDSGIHGKSKRTWNFLEVIPPQSLLCHLFQVKVNKEMWGKRTHFFPTQTKTSANQQWFVTVQSLGSTFVLWEKLFYESEIG